LPQIFTATADTWFRAAVVGVFAVVFGGLLFGGGAVRAAYLTRVGWPVRQPVPFSHKHHVGDDGIDCRYCHTSVETSADAGFPSTATCMTCHSQIWTQAPVLAPVRASYASGAPLRWNRVSQVPDYVFFNHAAHLNRGVPCVACHGRVDQMPLTMRGKPFEMRFCLDCHRDPAPHLVPHEMVTRMDLSSWEKNPLSHDFGRRLVREWGLDPRVMTNCGTCHR
jgi:hypothetical protein